MTFSALLSLLSVALAGDFRSVENPPTADRYAYECPTVSEAPQPSHELPTLLDDADDFDDDLEVASSRPLKWIAFLALTTAYDFPAPLSHDDVSSRAFFCMSALSIYETQRLLI